MWASSSKGLQLVLEPDSVARELELPAHHRAPQPLLGVRHKAQGQLLGHQPFHQAFGIGKVLLSSAWPAIGLGLGEVQRARRRPGALSRLAAWLPVPLQRFPHGPPILRGRFHDDFLNVLFKQPFSQTSQFVRTGPHPPPFELVLPLDFDIRHHHGQHPLVHIDSRDSVGHRFLLAGSGERASSHQSGSRAVVGFT
jgi:hypothetical protein